MSQLAPIDRPQLLSRGLVLSSLDEMWQFAEIAVKSKLLPRGIDTVEQVVIALQHGMELGFSPMQAVQSIAVINGRPCLWGDGLKALCESSPECEWIAETVDGTGDAMVATCVVKRRNRPEHTQSFSWADAKRASLTGKDTYKNYPQRMLAMRARSWALRDVFADVLKGVAVVEEQEDAPPRTVASVVEPIRRPQAKTQAATPATSPAPASEPVDTQPEPTPGKVTAKQVRDFWSAARKTGKTEEVVREHLQVVHGVESTKDMIPELYENTMKWASTVIE